ncbi:MAG: putative porin, partial [Bacteroidota bacterium]
GRQKPFYPLQKYYSTNFRWDTSFIRMDKTNIHLSYSNVKYHFETGIVYTILDNFISFDKTAMPVQNTSTFNVITAYMKKDILFHALVFRNMIYFQQSGNNALPLPEWCAYNSTFYNFHVFNKVLHIQLGFDIYYNTSFHAQAYMPATSVFYLQEEKKIGGYPYADVFLNANLKRVRFFLKMEHVNHEMMGRFYLSAVQYPAQGRMMKFGLSWSFYD